MNINSDEIESIDMDNRPIDISVSNFSVPTRTATVTLIDGSEYSGEITNYTVSAEADEVMSIRMTVVTPDGIEINFRDIKEVPIAEIISWKEEMK